MIMNTWYEEEANGAIIGSYNMMGQLYCNGRKQGQTIYAKSAEAMKDQANEFIAEKKAECGEVFNIIFPGKWELKIID